MILLLRITLMELIPSLLKNRNSLKIIIIIIIIMRKSKSI